MNAMRRSSWLTGRSGWRPIMRVPAEPLEGKSGWRAMLRVPDTSTSVDLPDASSSVEPVPLTRRRSTVVEREVPYLFAYLALHTESNFFSGFSGRLAEGGVFITTYTRLKVGQRVRLELCLVGAEFINLEGTVAWLRDPPLGERDIAPGVGISFVPPDVRAQELIQQFMARREPTFVDPEGLRQMHKSN